MNEELILLAHGGGGRLSRTLIEQEILPRFNCPPLRGLPDAAAIQLPQTQILFTTDSFVVHPLFFPGGCIGDLAVHGTVNDLAAGGGRPLWLSLGLILEEGLPLATLRRVLDAVQQAATHCDVAIAAGDTKVVSRGQCDGMYVNVSGIAAALPGFHLVAETIQTGDQVIVSGNLGDHGMAVLSAREDLHLETPVLSDSAPVHQLVLATVPWAGHIRLMRDPTRGGLASVLHELATACGFLLQETALPFSSATSVLAEILGINPLHSPCEGRLLAIIAPDAAPALLHAWRSRPEGRDSTIIGEVTAEAGRVVLATAIGGHTLIDMPHGELLPRIC